MEDLDMDCDFVEDPIKKFLLHKLEEIRLNNVELEEQLRRRKQVVDECLGTMASKFSDNLMEITETWNKVFDGKWIIGFFVKARNVNGILIDIQPVFQWDCSTALVYCTKVFTRYQLQHVEHEIFSHKKIVKLAKSLENQCETPHQLENEWMFSDKIKGTGAVIVSFEAPQFIERNEFKISGMIRYNCNTKQYQLLLPNFQIEAKYLMNNSNEIKSSDLVSNNEQVYLSILAVNEKHSLIVKIPSITYTSLDNQLEFQCMFLKVNVVTKSTIFYVDRISAAINGTIVQLQNEDKNNSLCTMNIFTRNQTSLQFLLHYLHQHIPGIIILPMKFKHQLEEITMTGNYSSQLETTQQHFTTETLFKKFGASLEVQIETVEKFCTKRLDELPDDAVQSDTVDLDVNIKDYKMFRKHLANLELESDILYNEIEKYT